MIDHKDFARKLVFVIVLAAVIGLPDLAAAQGIEETEAYKISQGGKLYDNWAKTLDVKAPEGNHPAYPAAMRLG